MTGLIFSGGYCPSRELIQSYWTPPHYIVAADKGYEYAAALQIKPDLYVGDLDSVSTPPIDLDKKIYPSEKDATDTELAIKAAIDHGCNTLILFGGIGSRADHTLANIFLLIPLAKRGIQLTVVNETNRISLITKAKKIEGQIGSLVSLIPVSDCFGVTTQNLHYPLEKQPLPLGTTRGISNRMIDTTAQISLQTGILLIIQASDHSPYTINHPQD